MTINVFSLTLRLWLIHSNSVREEEKQRRSAKRLAEKLEKARCDQEKYSQRHCEKGDRKNAERLERAKKRCEQIRQIIGSVIDPAHLNDLTSSSNVNVGASTSAPDATLANMHPSSETIRLLSDAIAGCLQPCNLINKILTDIMGMVPQPISETAADQAPVGTSTAQTPTAQAPSAVPVPKRSDQQQQTEISRQNSATNTSDANTPMSGHHSNQEIESLFKEAAKELEKMNEIVNSSRIMEASSSSLASSLSAITQIPNFSVATPTSIASEMAVINMEDSVDSGKTTTPNNEYDFKIITPPKSMRSRESSIEVHDANSTMSDDSRDWTMLDAAGYEQDESIEPQADSETKSEATKSVSMETQTPAFLAPTPAFVAPVEPSEMTQEEVRSSIQRSINQIGELSQVVRDSVALAQESLKNVHQPILQPIVFPTPKPVQQPGEILQPVVVSPPAVAPETPKLRLEGNVCILKVAEPTTPVAAIPEASAPTTSQSAPKPAARQPSILGDLSALTQANLAAARSSTGAKRKAPQVGPAVVVYDPNPKINDSVHQMMNMGFSNEGESLLLYHSRSKIVINCFTFLSRRLVDSVVDQRRWWRSQGYQLLDTTTQIQAATKVIERPQRIDSLSVAEATFIQIF